MIALPKRDTHLKPETAHLYQKDVWDEAVKHVTDWRVAVDCGAHVGIFTQRMEERFEEVYAFEPLAENFRCLAQNTTKARLFNCLLWEEPRMLGGSPRRVRSSPANECLDSGKTM